MSPSWYKCHWPTNVHAYLSLHSEAWTHQILSGNVRICMIIRSSLFQLWIYSCSLLSFEISARVISHPEGKVWLHFMPSESHSARCIFFVRSGISDLKPITFINTRVEWRSTLMRTVHGPTCHKDICQNPNNVFAVIVLVSFTTRPLLPVYLARE